VEEADDRRVTRLSLAKRGSSIEETVQI
jgi:hypothetical protein